MRSTFDMRGGRKRAMPGTILTIGVTSDGQWRPYFRIPASVSTMTARAQQPTANDQREYGCCQRRKPSVLARPASRNKRTTKAVGARL